jgi:cellulose synthase/poly-beta-1,6-N-acetylglucosamine synthase-like glycosyltransferase
MESFRPFISVIIPAFNAANIIHNTLSALKNQRYPKDFFEVIVVDDGSRDNTAEVAQKMGVVVLAQSNQGAGVARNLGVKRAKGEIILFTDSDCEPQEDWIELMVEPFQNPEVVGAKGFYKTKQHEFAARFAQAEYEIKCNMLKKAHYIDFIDTYSAAYRRDIFLEAGGFDAVYTTASGEDSELSYKLSMKGYKMVAVPNAFVYHLHPDTISKYLKKKYRNAYWRVVTWKKYPSKIARDSHTPNSYKFEVMLAPLFLLLLMISFLYPATIWLTMIIFVLFLVNETGFLAQVYRRDFKLFLISPLLLFLRGFAAAIGAAAKMSEMLIFSFKKK